MTVAGVRGKKRIEVKIAPLDLLWFAMETQSSPTHVGALLLFDKPRGRPGVVREIVDAYRGCEPVPPFNFVPELGGGLPHFRVAEAYDPCYHNQHLALPAGATYDDLLRLVSDLHEPMLDRGRPLFRNWFIDGVPGRRFALYVKVHHSITDGVSGMRRMYAGMSTRPERRVRTPAFAVAETVRRPRPPRVLTERIAELGLSATKQTLAVRDAYLSAVRRSVASLFDAEPAGSRPFTARRAPTNEPLRMARSLATLSLALDGMQELARRHGATLNDLAVTLVDEGLHRHLRSLGQDFAHRLVAFCPVSLRDDGDASPGTRVSAMFVPLGEPTAGVQERIAQVIAATRSAKQQLRSLSRDAALAYGIGLLGLAGLASAAHIDRVTPPLANLVISNVAGGRRRMYLNGAALAGIYPVPPLAVSIGLNVTLTSCHDHMDFGFAGNAASVRDMPALARHVAAAFRELQAARP